MASYDSNSVMMQEDEDDDQHHHRYSMSRLSTCNDDVIFNMPRLSVEDGSEADADGELSDGKEGHVPTDDSDRETGWFSLPPSPQQRRGRRGCEGRKEYGSENESGTSGGRRRRRRRRRGSSSSMMMRERWLERAWEKRKLGKAAMEADENQSGESECVVMAMPKAKGRGVGGKSLCMVMVIGNGG